jgi:SAM-dependent methyltransferase
VTQDVWASGEAYERYMGRWSRRIATQFLAWLGVPPGMRWLDVGCGTGALTGTVLATAEPAEIVGVDPSEGFVATARAKLGDARASFRIGDARDLPLPDDRFDAVVSGLVLNFVPEPAKAVTEWARVAAPGGVVATYLWDYVGGMEFLNRFWAVAIELDPAVAELEEVRRFQLNRPEPMRELWEGAGLSDVSITGLETPTVFRDFDDYWRPFLGGQGPAPGYAMAQSEERRAAIRDLLEERLPRNADGSIPLSARAWAIRGTFHSHA